MRLLLPREYLSGLLVMSLGFVFNIAYWSYIYSVERSGVYQELAADPLSTLPVLLSVPLFIIIGYYMIKERSLRAQVEESKGKLRETFSELHTILHTVPAGVITTDSEGLVNFFNRRAKEDLNLKESELIGTEVGKLFREPEVGEKVKELLSSEPQGKQAVLEASLRSGKVVQVSMSQMPG
ncbi:MAG: PAS domain-containing protein, partial [Euryarchaeota archaeon]|nr:PAS domain-containing protein [Euryarchaeota archaeon]